MSMFQYDGLNYKRQTYPGGMATVNQVNPDGSPVMHGYFSVGVGDEVRKRVEASRNQAASNSSQATNNWGGSTGTADNTQYSWQNAREAASQAHGYAMDLAKFNLDSQKGLMDRGAALRLSEMTHGSGLNKDEAQQGSNLRIRESDNSYTWQQALQKQNEEFRTAYLNDEQEHDETMFRKQDDAARRSTASDRMAARRVFRGM